MFWRMSGAKDFDFMGLDDQIGEFTLESGCFYDVVINPVVIATSGFSIQYAVVLEPMPVEPFFRDGAVGFGAGSEKGNDMAFFMPLIDVFECIRIRQASAHSLRFFIGNIITDGSININKKVFDPGGQLWADSFSLFVECCFQFRQDLTHNTRFKNTRLIAGLL